MIYVSYVPLHAHISVLEYVLVTEIIVNHITSRNPFKFFRLLFAGSVFIAPALRQERKPAFSFIARYRFWALLS